MTAFNLPPSSPETPKVNTFLDTPKFNAFPDTPKVNTFSDTPKVDTFLDTPKANACGLHPHGATDVELLRDGSYSDCVVRCGLHEWKTHKAILCPRNNYFHAAFCGESHESTTNSLTLDGKPWAVESFLYYLYTASYPKLETMNESERPSSSWELDLEMLRLADKTNASDLRSLALTSLLSTLASPPEDFSEGRFIASIPLLWSVASKHDAGARNKVLSFILINQKTLSKCEEYQKLWDSEKHVFLDLHRAMTMKLEQQDQTIMNMDKLITELREKLAVSQAGQSSASNGGGLFGSSHNMSKRLGLTGPGAGSTFGVYFGPPPVNHDSSQSHTTQSKAKLFGNKDASGPRTGSGALVSGFGGSGPNNTSNQRSSGFGSNFGNPGGFGSNGTSNQHSSGFSRSGMSNQSRNQTFGNTMTSQPSGLFGSHAPNQPSGGLFGTSTSNRRSSDFFGSSAPKENPSKPPGNNASNSYSGDLFGSSAPSQTAGTLFGVCNTNRIFETSN